MRLTTAIVIAGFAAMLATACSASGDEGESSASPAPSEPVSSATVAATATAEAAALSPEAIITRAQAASSQLKTFHMSLTMVQVVGGVTIDQSYEMDIELPERSYAVFEITGLSRLEMVSERLDVLVRFDGEDWRTLGDAFGGTAFQFEVDPPDFAAQLDVLTLAPSLQLLDDGDIGGVATYRIRAVFNAADYYAAVGEIMGASGLTGQAFESATGEVVLEYDVGQDDGLIRRALTTVDAVILGVSQQIESETRLSAFDEPVDIPLINEIAELDPIGAPGSLEDLVVGACFSLPSNSASVDEIVLLDCGERHLGETYYLVRYGDGPYPGETVLIDAAVEQCFGEFEGYIGVAYENSEVFADLFAPTAEMWERGQRDSACFLYLGTDRLIIGSLAGSER